MFGRKKQLDKSKRQIPTDEDELTWRYVKVDEPEIVYDYELFKNEFDEEIKKKQADFNETEFKSQPKVHFDTSLMKIFYYRTPVFRWLGK